jgi:Zn-dependent protease with chaperone function
MALLGRILPIGLVALAALIVALSSLPVAGLALAVLVSLSLVLTMMATICILTILRLRATRADQG